MPNGDSIFLNWRNNVIDGICSLYIKEEHLIYKCKFSKSNMESILNKEKYKDFVKNLENIQNNDNLFKNILNFDLFELSEKINGISLWELDNKIKLSFF